MAAMEALPSGLKGSLSLPTCWGRKGRCTPVASGGFFSARDYLHMLLGL